MDRPRPLTLQFLVPKQVNEILAFTKELLIQIQANVFLETIDQQKVKVIVVELVTNYIQHGSQDSAQIKVILDGNNLIIEKLQTGPELKFKSNHQFPFADLNESINISFSDGNSHYIRVQGDYEFQFLNQNFDLLTIDGMPEHFGFHIITVASQSFVYRHNPITQENHYVVKIELRGNNYP